MTKSFVQLCKDVVNIGKEIEPLIPELETLEKRSKDLDKIKNLVAPEAPASVYLGETKKRKRGKYNASTDTDDSTSGSTQPEEEPQTDPDLSGSG